MIKKYLLYPGKVYSQNDGDVHNISGYQLAKLYNVNLSECCMADSIAARKGQLEHLIKLKPRFDGDYTLPNTN